MDKIWVVVHIADFNPYHPERCIVRCERTLKLRPKGRSFWAWETRLKREIEVEIAVLDWWSNKRLPLYALKFEKVKLSMEQIQIVDLASKPTL